MAFEGKRICIDHSSTTLLHRWHIIMYRLRVCTAFWENVIMREVELILETALVFSATYDYVVLLTCHSW